MLRNQSLHSALVDARDTYAQKRPKTLSAQREAEKYLPGGNTRTVLYHGPFPIRVAKGEGARITDVDGHTYLNLLGEYTAGIFGHSHPVIQQAIHKALDVGVNLGAHNMAEVRLGQLVTERFPAMERVRFTNSGTEANLMAVSLARHMTKRAKVMVFAGGYHGALLYFAGAGSPINAPFPYVIGTYNDVDATRELIRREGHDIACVLVEPMLGSGGCLPADPAFLSMLREETAAARTHLIFDEVMTSRFGRGGAHNLLGITPDLLTLGKWVGGGMSFGAFGGRADIMALFDPSAPNALPHAGTFNNNTLSMHAGCAALSEAFTSDHAEALHELGENVRTRVNAIFENHGVAMCASGCGSLMNIHGRAGPITKVNDMASSDDGAKELLFLDMLERGFYMARRGFIALSLVVSQQDADAFVSALDDCVALRQPILPAR